MDEVFLNNAGPDGIKKKTNFSRRKIDCFYLSFEKNLLRVWNSRRANRYKYSLLDSFLRMLKVLKNGGSWNFSASVFKLKTPTHQRMTTKFVNKTGPVLYKMYIK